MSTFAYWISSRKKTDQTVLGLAAFIWFTKKRNIFLSANVGSIWKYFVSVNKWSEHRGKDLPPFGPSLWLNQLTLVPANENTTYGSTNSFSSFLSLPNVSASTGSWEMTGREERNQNGFDEKCAVHVKTHLWLGCSKEIGWICEQSEDDKKTHRYNGSPEWFRYDVMDAILPKK